MLMSRQQRAEWQRMPREEREKIREKNRGPRPGRYKTKFCVDDIAVLDFETDPGDAENDAEIVPFLAVLYARNFEPVIIWDEDFVSFKTRVIAAIMALPRHYMVYAHNGGKFDYMFLLPMLRGHVTFKGRGLMEAEVGPHRLRDSLHILPVALRTFEKDEFDYSVLRKDRRNEHREIIIKYCLNDCRYLYDVLYDFITRYGFKLTIGQAAFSEIKTHYEFDRLNENLDANFRRFFFGGRVECLQGAGRFADRRYKLFDVNSMYPDVMAHVRHPHLTNNISFRFGEPPSDNTFFIRLNCKNRGAFVSRKVEAVSPELAAERGWSHQHKMRDDVIIDGMKTEGEFFTTIHEYKVAVKYGLISDVEFIECIDFADSTTFEKFVYPRYESKQANGKWLDEHADLEGTDEYKRVWRAYWFDKFFLNNGYGKFAQDPSAFKERMILDADQSPNDDRYKDDDRTWSGESFPELGFSIWETAASGFQRNNVAVGASITGAARAKLLEAICRAENPIYCDTDSLFCEDLPLESDPSKLGAWKLEGEFDEVLLCGKKMYAAKNIKTGKVKSAHKGAPGLHWDHYSAMLAGETVKTVSKVPTISRDGSQSYVRRNIRVTGRRKKEAENGTDLAVSSEDHPF